MEKETASWDTNVHFAISKAAKHHQQGEKDLHMQRNTKTVEGDDHKIEAKTDEREAKARKKKEAALEAAPDHHRSHAMDREVQKGREQVPKEASLD